MICLFLNSIHLNLLCLLNKSDYNIAFTQWLETIAEEKGVDLVLRTERNRQFIIVNAIKIGNVMVRIQEIQTTFETRV